VKREAEREKQWSVTHGLAPSPLRSRCLSTRNPQRVTHNRFSPGFTLLEALLAMVIVAMAVTAILQLFSSNLGALSALDDHVRAVLRAEGRMGEILDEGQLSERTWVETTADGYRIEGRISKVQEARAQIVSAGLFEIDLTLSYLRGIRRRTINLKTLKLVPKGETGEGVTGEREEG
jgi:type II secretion system protein I